MINTEIINVGKERYRLLEEDCKIIENCDDSHINSCNSTIDISTSGIGSLSIKYQLDESDIKQLIKKDNQTIEEYNNCLLDKSLKQYYETLELKKICERDKMLKAKKYDEVHIENIINNIKPDKNALVENIKQLSLRQKKFLYCLSELYNGSSKKLIILNSPAGTGKTHVIKLASQLFNNKLIILTPTHKAKQLYTEHKIQASTIHRFFGYEPCYDENGTQTHIFKGYDKQLNDNRCILIIDECSMVNKLLYELIIESNFKGIVFIGDENQLPPVISQRDIENNKDDGKTIFQRVLHNKFKFTTIYRTKNSYVIDCCKKYLDDPIQPKFDSEKINFKKMIELFKENDDTILLNFTNKAVTYYSKLIRENLFGTNTEDFKVGEKLIFSGYRPSCKFFYGDIQDFYDMPIYSSYIIHIKKINITYMQLDELIIRDQTDLWNDDKIDDKIYNKDKSYYCFYQIIDQKNILWFIPHNKSKMRVNAFFSNMKKITNTCIKNNINLDESLDESLNSFITTMKKYEFYNSNEKTVQKIWKSFYGLQSWFNPNVAYNYSLTVHKAQGSQYTNVIVNIDDINKNRSYWRKLGYTACSRTKENLYFI